MQPTKNTLLQAATSQPTNQSLQESIFSPTQEKLKNKKSPQLQKNKTSQPHSANLTQTSIDRWTALKKVYSNVTHYYFGQTKAHAGNSTYPKGGVSCSKDCFVVNPTLVFQIKFCGESPALRVAANRQTVQKPSRPV